MNITSAILNSMSPLFNRYEGVDNVFMKLLQTDDMYSLIATCAVVGVYAAGAFALIRNRVVARREKIASVNAGGNPY